MNKVLNINLGGYPFVIDDDAFLQLEKYLKRLQRHFRGSQGYDDIMHDIEGRLAELFSEKMGPRKIIMSKDVDECVAIMGHPEEFDDGTTDEKTFYNDNTQNMNTATTKKRLYRDAESKVIGGVCSGLGAYFGIDKVWVRLIFFISFFTFGFGLLPYIILWILVPEAVTSAEKLSMEGEPVNIHSIANKIQEDLSDLTQKISDLGQELKNK